MINDINEDIIDQYPSNSMKNFFKELNTFNNNNMENEGDQIGLNCNYMDIESFNYKSSKNKLAFFHLNIASITKHKDELVTILSMLDYEFDFIGITESKLKKSVSPITNIGIEGYQHYSTPAEGDKGGTMIYVANKFNCRTRHDLETIMYKTKQNHTFPYGTGVFAEIELCRTEKT